MILTLPHEAAFNGFLSDKSIQTKKREDHIAQLKRAILPSLV
jgi:hypothetical protein